MKINENYENLGRIGVDNHILMTGHPCYDGKIELPVELSGWYNAYLIGTIGKSNWFWECLYLLNESATDFIEGEMERHVGLNHGVLNFFTESSYSAFRGNYDDVDDLHDDLVDGCLKDKTNLCDGIILNATDGSLIQVPLSDEPIGVTPLLDDKKQCLGYKIEPECYEDDDDD